MKFGPLLAALVATSANLSAIADTWTEVEEIVSSAIDRGDAATYMLSRHKKDELCAWIATEILTGQGQTQVAKEFLRGLDDPTLAARLRRYSELRRRHPVVPAEIDILKKARRLRFSNRPAAALRILPSASGDDSVLSVICARERGASLRALDRRSEGDLEFLNAAKVATQIGWWEGATASLRQTAVCRGRGASRSLTSATLTRLRRQLTEREAVLIYTPLHAELVCVGLTRSRTVMLPVGSCASLRSALVRDGTFVGAKRGATLDVELAQRAEKALLAPLDALPPVSHLCLVPDWAELCRVSFGAFARGHSISYHDPELLYRYRSSLRKAGRGVLAVQSRKSGKLELGRRGLAGRLLAAESVDARVFSELASRTRWAAIHIAAPLERGHGGFRRPNGDPLLRVGDLLHVDADLIVLSSSWSGLALAPHQSRFKRLDWARVLAASGEKDAVASYVSLLDSNARASDRGIPTKALLLAPLARGCMVHLWQKDPDASRVLIRKFYELWFETRGENRVASAARALREAQELVRSQSRWEHRYYWAGWQLWGITE